MKKHWCWSHNLRTQGNKSILGLTASSFSHVYDINTKFKTKTKIKPQDHQGKRALNKTPVICQFSCIQPNFLFSIPTLLPLDRRHWSTLPGSLTTAGDHVHCPLSLFRPLTCGTESSHIHVISSSTPSPVCVCLCARLHNDSTPGN